MNFEIRNGVVRPTEPPPPFWTHKRVSYLKSIVRMASSVFALAFPFNIGLAVLAIGYGLAEVLGVWEELGSRGD